MSSSPLPHQASPIIPTPAGYPPKRAVVAWIFFDWAAQPFFTLITTFVFAPYFAAHLAADPVTGQSLWGYATGLAGLVIALTSPFLGAVADTTGPKKPWIVTFGLLLVAGSAALWWAVPGASGAVALALLAFILATIGAEFATVFNNSMMPHLVPPERMGRLSGAGWATGYIGGLISLAMTLLLFAASPDTGKTLVGLTPLFGLDAATFAGDRLVGPLTALWFVVFVTPMLLLTPDVRPSGIPLKVAMHEGFRSLVETVRTARSLGDIGRFLLANMIYQDGLVALFAFGGIYAAGVFGWGTIEIGVFGILLTLTGTIGAFIGGRLDDAIGGKRVILGALTILVLCCLGILSLGREHILFMWPTGPMAPGAGLYAHLPEKVYVALGLAIGLVAGPLQASSRSLLVRLAPPGQAGQFFGLFALSGKVTSFLGPTLVATATFLFDSQSAGLAVLIGFFGVGGLLIAGVRAR
ncbi:MFS transporter [Chelatococcus asaccharovorans]|uniref:MFS transporter n=1 Tax=Chelatococcus asaccharovorans TaxID=28210 RepID=UPI00224C6E2D|nr:MFS transporter [Chelatococcus asaccharovorans]CAH1657208.1 UMF1 family MFS transporter [Chelatococcus asaccharovorans]CAH1684861.1 UMF1 family MFS transporter [Chelatococcus asaccharovorans]